MLLLCVLRGGEVDEAHKPAMHDFNRVTPEQWANLAQRTFYFGHQSVGANIIDGVREIAARRPDIKLRVVSEAREPLPGALNAFRIGRNEDPESKNVAVVQAAQGDLGPRPVIMFKYCYVDLDVRSDPAKLFERYRQTVAHIRAQRPEVTVVHVTVPLMTNPSIVRVVMNKLRGIATSRDENAVRAEYNRTLRAEYLGREPVFDLAALEATRADGSIEHSVVNGTKVPALAREWSSDSGHLNAAGRRRIAEQFLATLATLSSTSTPIEAR